MSPSSSGDRGPEPNVQQSSSAVSQTSNSPSVVRSVGKRVWGAAALVTLVFTVFVGGWQWLRPVLYPPPGWTSIWKYILPLEFHAQQKLPDFENGNIRTVEVVPDSDRVWIAGDQGLLAYSDDGFTWTTYDWDGAAGIPKKRVAAAQTPTSAPAASLFPSVLAASLPQTAKVPRRSQQQQQSNQQQPAANPPPLQISKIVAVPQANGDFAIEWVTNLLAASQVEYGTSIKYGSRASNPSLVATHRVVLSNLTPKTQYHYRVVEDDGQGRSVVSQDQTFLTSAPSGASVPTPPAENRFGVRIGSPRPGERVSGAITLSARATGPAVPDSLRFTIDGKDAGVAKRYARGVYSLQFDTTQLSDGIHSVAAVARDLKGDTETSDTVSLATNNGVSAKPAPDFGVVLFEDAQNGRVIAANLDQFSTKDGGATWGKMPQRFTNSETLKGPRVTHGLHPYDQAVDPTAAPLSRRFQLEFTNPANTLAVSRAAAYETGDVVRKLQTRAFAAKIAAAKATGLLVRSRDGARIAADEIRLAFSAWGDGKNQAWVCGAVAVIKTTDQGGKWTEERVNQLSPPNSWPEQLSDITFQEDARHGWVVGRNGVIFSTKDGGEIWHPATRSALGQAAGAITSDERYWKFPAPWTLPAALLFLFFVHRATRRPAAAPLPDSIATKAVRDSPLEPGEPDVLGLGRIARALSGFLRNEGTQPPITIAVNGEWGTGKSSLMNLLRKDLEKRRFCPVWFNAWHNQEEPNLLAALLQTVKMEAVPPTFSNRPWVHFRRRLLWRRVQSHAVLLAALAAGAALFGGYRHELRKHTGHGVAKEIAEQYLKLFPPGISEEEAKRRQQTVDGLAQVTKKLAAIPKQPADVRKQIDEITQEIGQLSKQLAQDAKVPGDSSAKLAEKVDRLAKLTSAENKPSSDAEAQERVKTLTGVLEEARALAQEIVNVTQKPASSGATSAKTAENGIQILGILGTLLGVLRGLWKALTAFGANPASLLAALSGGTKKSALEEQTSFRKEFTREFEEVSWALRPATLTIFIDDLDRCRPEKVSELLEAVNYVTTSGRCLVVLALERKTVEASVGLAFQGIAEERNYQNPDGAPPDPAMGDGILGESRRRRAAFAMQYLDKLINIEVDVPKLSTDRAAEVTKIEEEPQIAAWQKWGGRIWAMRWAALGVSAAVVLTIAGYYAGVVLAPPERTPPQLVAPPIGEGTETNTETKGPEGQSNKGVKNPDNGAQNAVQGPPPVYHEGGPAHPNTGNAGLWVLLLLGAAALAVVIRTILYARREDLRAVEKDSESFQAALKIWLPVVEARQPTPRSVKRFLNRVRFLACLQQPGPFGEGPTPIPESLLIALAALYKIDPQMVSDEKQFERARDSMRSVPFVKPIAKTFEIAWRKHEETFHDLGEMVSYRTRFLELLPGFTQH